MDSDYRWAKLRVEGDSKFDTNLHIDPVKESPIDLEATETAGALHMQGRAAGDLGMSSPQGHGESRTEQL